MAKSAPKPRDRRTRAELAAALSAADAELLTTKARVDALRSARDTANDEWSKAAAELAALRTERDALKVRAEKAEDLMSTHNLTLDYERVEARYLRDEIVQLRNALTSTALVLAERDADLRVEREACEGLTRRLARLSAPASDAA
mgnify:CR=1 FL=1